MVVFNVKNIQCRHLKGGYIWCPRYRGIILIIFVFLTLNNYAITTMKNITDDSTTDNSICRTRIHV